MSVDDLVIRVATPADAPAVRRVVLRAFGDGDERAPHAVAVGELVTALDRAGATRASLVAERADTVVGHVQLSRSWVDARERLVEVLVLSPLSVDPQHQRAGVGTALLAAARERAAGLGVPALFLEGSPAYYGGRGWQRGRDHGFEPPSERIPDPAFQVVLLPAHEAWMTGRLVYCEPFWALDCVGLRDPDYPRESSTSSTGGVR